ncbi:DUF952 domain-containing protein [Rhodococcus rhodnii]|uniref:DUF952 domain-containing protein n=1 Tax=Rhodococcus rhodnii TaxID=38312 RepID=A0A6P2CIQ5_9NOCA|nr:DUF952 domain-containing protein [Rhodococcus rhodnii]
MSSVRVRSQRTRLGAVNGLSDVEVFPDASGGTPLVHLCSESEWSALRRDGERRPPGFAADGFVHLSTPNQVHLPADRLFRGRNDLVLLTLDAARLGAPVRFEPGVADDPADARFPHLYGPLPLGAVIRAEPYPPGPDGRFPPRET